MPQEGYYSDGTKLEFNKDGRPIYKSSTQRRRDRRKADKALRKNGPKTAHWGGSEEAQNAAREEAKADTQTAKAREKEQYSRFSGEADRAKSDAMRADRERLGTKLDTMESRGKLGGHVDAMRGDAEGVLSKRAAELAGKPTIGDATEAGIKANMANAREQLAQQVGMMNRQARGAAGSLGEGGALAMQQAMASAGANAADLAAMNQNQQNQLAGNMRYQAGLAQRSEDVDTSNIGAQARLGTMQQQLAARQGMLNQDLAAQQLATNQRMNLGAQANAMTSGMYGAAAQGLGNARAQQMGMEGTILGIENRANQQAYQNALNNNFGQKVLSQVFDPMDIRGSGSKGWF